MASEKVEIPKIQVVQGPIKVNSVDLVACVPNVWALEADLKAKRAEIATIGDTSVDLWATTETLHAHKSKRMTTTLRILGLGDNLRIEATVARYTLYITVVRLVEMRKELWRSKN